MKVVFNFGKLPKDVRIIKKETVRGDQYNDFRTQEVPKSKVSGAKKIGQGAGGVTVVGQVIGQQKIIGGKKLSPKK